MLPLEGEQANGEFEEGNSDWFDESSCLYGDEDWR